MLMQKPCQRGANANEKVLMLTFSNYRLMQKICQFNLKKKSWPVKNWPALLGIIQAKQQAPLY